MNGAAHRAARSCATTRAAIIGLRIVYAPVEDLLFGFAMVLLTLTLWVLGSARRAAPRQRRAAGRWPGRPRRGAAARRATRRLNTS